MSSNRHRRSPGRPTWGSLVRGCLGGLLILGANGSDALAAPTFAVGGAAGMVTSGLITEASGLAASRQNPGVLWTHNDSSFPGSVFALSSNGTVLARLVLSGVAPGDFEDLAIGPGPNPAQHYLYLGEIGDNAALRTSVKVYRFPEPAIYPYQSGQLLVAAGSQMLTLTYPDGPHNAEAMFVDPILGDLYIVTKSISAGGLYRATAAALAAGGTVPMTFLRPLGMPRVSAGDISPDGRMITLRNGSSAAVWSRGVRQDVAAALGAPARAIPVVGEPVEINGESITFDPAARGYFTLSEGVNQPLFVFRRTDAGAPRPPVALVGPGELWRHLALGPDPGTAWRGPGFDDSAWAQGAAPLGYGQGDERTVLGFGPNPSAKQITTLYRKTFQAPASALTNRLVLRLCYTDGAAVYLNGTEILRRNLAPDPGFEQVATGSNADLQNTWSWFAVPPSLLVAGENVLAAELHRLSPAGGSLTFDAQLVTDALDHVPDGTDPGEPPDSTPPRVAITAPAANVVVTNEVLTVRGSASDNIGLARVEWRLGSNAPQPVTGAAAWSAAIPLEVGTNVVTVIARDFRTNASIPAVRQFIRRAVSPIVVETSGPGTVTPRLSGLSLLVGNNYTINAAPAARHLFAGWEGVGGSITNAARLTFVMESNLWLRARFVTNPFYAVKGVYRGLFEDTNTVSHERSGSITVNVTASGTFTAALRLAGRSAALSGRFNLQGAATRTIAPVSLGPLTVTLSLDLEHGTERITGWISGADWTSPLLAYRPPVRGVANPAPFAGRYTLRMAGSTNESGPLGHGVAGLVVAGSGRGTLAGTLADGTKLAQAAPASAEGAWPLYVPLYAGRGSVLGWLSISNLPTPGVQGRMNWVRPADPLARPLPAGFTNVAAVDGGGYTAAAATNQLSSLSNLCLTLRGLSQEPETRCLRRINRDTYAGDGFRTLKLSLATGLWSGSFTNPATRTIVPARFTLLLPEGTGYGHVLGTNFSAALELPPAP